MLGSLVPSSRLLINDVMAQVDWERARVVVEYGPGVGTITQEVLKRLHPEAVLVAIELNGNFVEFLEDEIRDPRVRLVHDSALHVRQVLEQMGLPKADYIISGIPFTNMRAAFGEALPRKRGRRCSRTARWWCTSLRGRRCLTCSPTSRRCGRVFSFGISCRRTSFIARLRLKYRPKAASPCLR